ncbi:hypothetical protein AVEN_218732-1 [Araneus ventricosus]|uniref:Uncharacterized protein n=1 Tax=Araneus ventricosus TaxID=182803 RepID=A0A4Y2B6R6_ARAVE|nr:hypothetical protein AVEN_218732-1 [Araneus ventricosus]
MPFLFTFRASQPPEIGAMAKITLLHRVAYEKAAPSSGLTSLGMKIRNRHVESCVYKNVLELQNSGIRIGEFVNSTSPLMSQYPTSKVIDRIAISECMPWF